MMPAKTCIQRSSRFSHSLRVGSRVICAWCFVLSAQFKMCENENKQSSKYESKVLTSTIGRITVRTDQKRNVIMLRTVVDVEDDRYLRVEAVDAERSKVWFSVKDQTVCTIRHCPIDEKERFHAPVSVGPCMAQLGPALVCVL